MDATWCLKERLVQLFGLIVQNHDATIGKFSGRLGLNGKVTTKGCWILAWSLFGRIMCELTAIMNY